MRTGAAELLYRARDRVRHGWCQTAEARNGEGTEVEPWDADASSWSLLGALVAAFEDGWNGNGMPLADLAVALDVLEPLVDDDSLAHWNDAPSQTQANVAGVLHTAAGAASTLAQEPPPPSQN